MSKRIIIINLLLFFLFGCSIFNKGKEEISNQEIFNRGKEYLDKHFPVNKTLYARVKAEAKRKFAVYPSAYANAWLVREYKKRGGTYRVEKKRGKK